LVEKGSIVFSEVTPFIPSILTEVGDVSFLPKCHSVWIGNMKLEVGLVCQVVDPRSPFNAVVPEDHWRVLILHVLPDNFLQQSNVELSLVGPRCTFLQGSQRGSNLIAEGFHLLRYLFPRHVRNKSIRGANLLGKLLHRQQCFTFPLHRNHIDKALVRQKLLAAGMSRGCLSTLLGSKEGIYEEVIFDPFVS
jgi:hypothetical protein